LWYCNNHYKSTCYLLKKIVRRIFKIIGWVVLSIVALLVLVIILIQIPAVQDFGRKKIVSFLRNKIHTKVEIRKLAISFPKKVVLEGVFMEDQQKDTLLATNKLEVDIDMFKLLKSTVAIKYIGLDGATAKVKRLQPDSTFNFDYIIKAFTSGETDTTTSSEPSSMKFELGTVSLKNIRAVYKDDVTGSDVDFNLGDFETNIKTFDLNKSIYEIPSISIAHIRTSVRQYKPLIEPKPMAQVEAESNEPFKLTLGLKDIRFQDIRANYQNDVSALKAAINMGTLAADIKNIDLATLLVQLNKVQLDSTSIDVTLGKSQQAIVAKEEVKKETVAQANNPWKVELASLALNNNRLVYNDNNAPVLKKGMDYSHLDIQNFLLNADNFIITPTEYNGALKQLSFDEKSGFQLKQLSTEFAYNEKEASIKNLVLKTNNSTITSALTAKYPSVEALSKKPGEVFADLKVDTFLLATKDILLLAPQLEPQLKGYTDAVIKAQLKGRGYIKDLRIDDFALSGYGATNLQMNGNIKGLPDGKKAWYDLKLVNFNTTRKDLLALIPKNSMPSNIRIPEKINARGFFKGTMNAFNTFLAANTSKGSADITAAVSNNYKTYNVKAALKKLDVGYLTKQDTLVGKITLNATAKGNGLDYKKMVTAIHADLVEGEIKGYTYRHLLMDANLDKGAATLTSSMEDSNFTYHMDALANLAGKFPSDVKMNLQLDTINLTALHFVPDTMQLQAHTELAAEFTSANPDSLVGALKIYDIKFRQDSLTIRTDTVLLAASNEQGLQAISLQSEVANLDWKGQYKLTEIGTALQHTINQYYKLPGFKDTAFTAQNWQMNMLVKPAAPLVLQFVPGLKGSDTISANISYNSEANDLKLQALAPHVQYGEQAIEKTSINAATNNQQLDYEIKLESAGSKGFKVYETSLAGNVADNILTTALTFKDRNNKQKYQLAGKLQQLDSNAIRFSFNPDSLMLDYERWQMMADNYIQYDTTGIIVHNFQLSKEGQSFGLNSTSESTQAPIEAAFKDFKIKTLTDFAEQDSLLVDGVIDGKAVVSNVMKSPVFTTDLTIKDLSYKKDTIGTIVAKVDNETANAYNANVSIQGKGNDIVLDGKYYTGESRMDLHLNINNVSLNTLTGLSAGQLKDAGGSLKGKVDIAGTTSAPEVNGNLNFEKAYLTPTMLGEKFSLPNEKINVTSKGINFDKFTMVDSSGNKAILDGDILTTDFTDYAFNLSLNAKNFRLINSTKTDNPLFYGKLNMDADIKLGGNMQTPSVTASLKANKATDLTFVLPSSDPEVVSREGVVNFVDMDAPADSTAPKKTDETFRYAALSSMDVSANFETDTAALFTMVIDERNGDAVKIRGKADLSGGIDESGRMTLTGNYQVQRGDYQLTLSLLQKKFEIQNGSTITWTGDPMSANVDITALYRVSTAPIDLMETQISNRSQDFSKYKQKIPVEVYLKMTGELTKPIISFDVALDERTASQWKEVETKIEQLRNDESEVNKQVFALLLLGRFVQENPFESAGPGTSNETLIKQSASRLLADQLNKLAGSLVKGVDLNFGLNSEDDYSTGQRTSRTDLTVGVSKSLLNDRLRVNVGSNFELEGANSNQQASNIAGDVAIDYQLSKDGRYMIRGYRKNEYEGVVEGQIIETGLTFIFTLDYDQFRELFGKKKKVKTKQANNNTTDKK